MRGRARNGADRRAGGGVWLHSTDPALAPVLSVLAAALRELPEPPGALQITGTPEAPGPGEDARTIEAMFEAFPAALLVLAGAVLPATLIERARARGVAVMLIEAETPRLSGRWRLFPGATRALLGQCAQVHAVDATSAAALTRAVRGAVPVFDSGRLARFAPARPCNTHELEAMRRTLGARPVWFAHALPPGEAEPVCLAHAQALRRAHRLVLIVQPRDPAEGAALAECARDVGFVTARRALDEDIAETTQVYIADTEDEAGLFLRLASVSFLGGTLTPGAGSPPPLEAAALGSALVFGPAAEGETAAQLELLRQRGAGRRIAAGADLGEAVSALLSPEQGAEVALKAWTLASEGAEATATVARAIGDWLALNGGRA